jgi:hypothetical protein
MAIEVLVVVVKNCCLLDERNDVNVGVKLRDNVNRTRNDRKMEEEEEEEERNEIIRPYCTHYSTVRVAVSPSLSVYCMINGQKFR